MVVHLLRKGRTGWTARSGSASFSLALPSHLANAASTGSISRYPLAFTPQLTLLTPLGAPQEFLDLPHLRTTYHLPILLVSEFALLHSLAPSQNLSSLLPLLSSSQYIPRAYPPAPPLLTAATIPLSTLASQSRVLIDDFPDIVALDVPEADMELLLVDRPSLTMEEAREALEAIGEIEPAQVEGDALVDALVEGDVVQESNPVVEDVPGSEGAGEEDALDKRQEKASAEDELEEALRGVGFLPIYTFQDS